ncbi:hypothetical protein ANME2D_03011 [Candidatus Methanoperedens nitroreducens]|uniref:Uncharacterized protein n=1 Tax=Candidatus Methanoperedens nitratireducens TaxID=1392998 RepID=A0A062V0U6_9EURY|nr:hypothetical protein [Candidatus Methanoperedens nitroreducens]KCZ70982.1 hypothetical protein ANME2D_03011 [Candidatus Methanoperedens nitroreducens]MDJ1421648.1 hypothetical protein [Candidatus Methanoperedens sp.]
MSTEFIDTFVEIYNVEAAIAMIFFCGLIIVRVRKIDIGLLKARLFLNNAIIQQAWMYISIGVVFLALNTLMKFMNRVTAIENILNRYYIVELTQVIFLMAFTLSIYNLHLFINSSVKNKSNSTQYSRTEVANIEREKSV